EHARDGRRRRTDARGRRGHHGAGRARRTLDRTCSRAICTRAWSTGERTCSRAICTRAPRALIRRDETAPASSLGKECSAPCVFVLCSKALGSLRVLKSRRAHLGPHPRSALFTFACARSLMTMLPFGRAPALSRAARLRVA